MTEAISKPIDKTYKAHREHLELFCTLAWRFLVIEINKKKIT